MITIAIIRSTSADGVESISPAETFPEDRVAVVCDGERYTVYQPGDVVPAPPEA